MSSSDLAGDANANPVGSPDDAALERVAAIAGDGIAAVALGVKQAEASEGVVYERAHDGIEACSPGLPSELELRRALTDNRARRFARRRCDRLAVALE